MKSIIFVGCGGLLGFSFASVLFMFSFLPTQNKPKTARPMTNTHLEINKPNYFQDMQNARKQLSNLKEERKNLLNHNHNEKIIAPSPTSVPTCVRHEIKLVKDNFNSTELVETIQAERRATLKKACNGLRDRNVCPSKINGINDRLFYSKNYKVLACAIQKCGYKTWLKSFYFIEEKTEEYFNLKRSHKSVLALGEKLFRLNVIKNQATKQEAFDNSLKVIIVRHPFSRLVSAYYDKMVPTSVGYQNYYGRISREISQNYRHLRHNVTERNQIDDGNATFEDFVNFLIRLKKFDNHWKPFRDMCNPCSSQYDYIAKFETLNNDMEYLKQKINLTEEHRKYFFPKGNFATNFNLMKKTFEKVPNELAHRLYEVYKEDFQVFGYRLPEWLCLSQH